MNQLLSGLIAAVIAAAVVFSGLAFGVGTDFATERIETPIAEPVAEPGCDDELTYSRKELMHLEEQITTAGTLIELIEKAEAKEQP